MSITNDNPSPEGREPDSDTSNPKSDLFANLQSLRLPQNFEQTVGVKKAILTIPTRKPSKEWFVRTNASLRIETCVLELKEDREVYLVSPDLWTELVAESTFGTRALYGAINRQGVFFVWPVRLPGADGKLDDWNRSALEAASMAEKKWIRIASNMSLGAYEVFEAQAEWPEPEWPEISFGDILRIAFKGRVVETLDHPVLKRLRGEA